jgi:glycosyltransferase involved in cell wall biosynthesis
LISKEGERIKMENKFLVSIVMPVYNSENYLERAADSLFRQDFTAFEIIFVDDCSEDKSREILKSYENRSNVTVLYNANNIGAAESRNRGLKQARGDYVIVLDSDDYVEPCLISKAYEAAAENHADLVVWGNKYCYIKSEEHGKEEIASFEYRLPAAGCVMGEKTEEIISRAGFWSWNKMVRRALLEKYQIAFQNIPTNNDVYYAVITTLCAENIVFIGEALITHYNGHYNSISFNRARKGSNRVKAFEYTLDKVKEKCPQHYKSCEKFALTDIYSALSGGLSEAEKQLIWNQSKESDWVQKTIYKLQDFFKEKTIALWGCGVKGKRFIDMLEKLQIRLDGVIDMDVEKQGTKYLRYTISAYDPERRDYDYFIVPGKKFRNEVAEMVGEKRVIGLEDICSILVGETKT